MDERTVYVWVAERLHLIANGAVDLGIGTRCITVNVVDIASIVPDVQGLWICRSYLRPPEWVDYLVESRS